MNLGQLRGTRQVTSVNASSVTRGAEVYARLGTGSGMEPEPGVSERGIGAQRFVNERRERHVRTRFLFPSYFPL